MMRRAVLLLLVASALAAPLAACGKKGNLEAPGGSTYPRQYPPEPRSES